MRPLTGKDILDFYASGDDYLVLTSNGDFQSITHSRMLNSGNDDRHPAYDIEGTADGEEVQILLDVRELAADGYFSHFLGADQQPSPTGADEVAAYVTDECLLGQRIKWVSEYDDNIRRAEELVAQLALDRSQLIAVISAFAQSSGDAAAKLGVDEAAVDQAVAHAATSAAWLPAFWPPARTFAPYG